MPRHNSAKMSSEASIVGIPGGVARKVALFQVQDSAAESGTLRLCRKDVIKRKKSASGRKASLDFVDLDFNNSSSVCAVSTVSSDSCYGESSTYEKQFFKSLESSVASRSAGESSMKNRLISGGEASSSDYLNLFSSGRAKNVTSNSRRLKDCYQSFTLPRRPGGKLVLQLVEFSESSTLEENTVHFSKDDVTRPSKNETFYEELDQLDKSKSLPFDFMPQIPTKYEDNDRPPSPVPYESIYAEPIYGENESSGGSSSYWSPSSSIYSNGTSHNVLLNNTSVSQSSVPSFQPIVSRFDPSSDLNLVQLPPLPNPNPVPASQNKFSSIAKSAGRKLARKLDYIRRFSRTGSVDGSSISLSPSPLPSLSCPSPFPTNQTSSLYNLSQSSSSSMNPSSAGESERTRKVTRPISRPRMPPPEPPPPPRSSTLDRKHIKSGSASFKSRRGSAAEISERNLDNGSRNGWTERRVEPKSRQCLDSEDFEDSDFCDSDSELIRNFVSAVQPIYSMEEEPLYQYYTYGISLQPEDDYQPVIPKNLGLTLEMLIPRQGQRTLWCQIPEVLNSGILAILSDKQKQFQESIFEILTSEVSYLKSLDVLISLFYEHEDLTKLLSESDRAALFGNINAVRESSKLFLKDLLGKWEESWYIHEVGNLIRQNSENRFSVYVDYCRNKPYQDRILQSLRNTSDEFLNVIKSIEEDRKCENLRMDSFLMLPMQRITRLPLLVNAIIQRTQSSNEKDECEQALRTLTDLVIECNEAARESQDLEETGRIMEKLEFPRGFRRCQNPGQFLLKGDFMKNPFESGRGTPKINWTFQKSKRTFFCLILFTRQLFITKKRSSGKLEVVDIIPPKNAHIKGLPTLEGVSKDFQHYFMLHFEGREIFLSGRTQSEVDRWRLKLDQVRTVKDIEVKAIFPYEAERDDELSFVAGEVIQVSQKQPDGWYYGSKENGDEGWFPGNYATEYSHQND